MPAGGVLSPFLRNLVLDSLLVAFTEAQEFIQAFADDLALIVSGIDVSVLRCKAQQQLNFCQSWCRASGLSLSSIKTKVVMFSRKRSWALSRALSVNATELHISSPVKYLGVIIDKTLSWGEHVSSVSDKSIKILFASKKAVGKKWGFSPKSFKRIYEAIVRPSLSYCSVVWAYSLWQFSKREACGQGSQARLPHDIQSLPQLPSLSSRSPLCSPPYLRCPSF